MLNLRHVILCILLCLLCASAICEETQETMRHKDVTNDLQDDFINPDAPSVTLPNYQGERYDTVVPDTLDIAERSKLAIRGLTGPLDPRDGYTLYWLINYSPGNKKKEAWVNLRAKFIEAMPLLRLVTGSDHGEKIEQVWVDNLLRSIGPDGLIYKSKKEANGQFSSIAGCGMGRLMGAMMIYYQLDGNPMWKEILEKMIVRLSELAIDKGDYAYFYYGNVPVDWKVNGSEPMPKGVWAVDGFNGRIVQELGQYYALTGFEPAKTLGDKLIRYLLEHAEYYGPNGEWLKDQLDPNQYPGRQDNVHFGTHSHTLLYMLDYAIGTNNRSLMEYVRKSFEWGMRENSTICGQCETATRIGFFIEYLIPYYPTSEHCGVADMVAIGAKLSAHSIGDYWDDVDGWVRNHFIENQMQSADWVGESDQQLARQNVGTFFSWPSANDGCPKGHGHMHCCMGNGSRTLYYIWNSMLKHDNGTLQVNLLMNRASRWADVNSHIPYTGQVDVVVKESLEKVLIRVPEWIESGSPKVRLTCDGETRPILWEGRYINAGSAQGGETLTMTFPIETKTMVRKVYETPLENVIGGVVYDSLTFKGNTVIDIQPEGKNYPYYQRDHYRQNKAPMHKVERFIPEEQIDW